MPFFRVLIGDLCDPGSRVFKDVLVKRQSHFELEEMSSPPRERGLLFLAGSLLDACERKVYIPKILRHERLDLVVSRDDESESGELTWT